MFGSGGDISSNFFSILSFLMWLFVLGGVVGNISNLFGMVFIVVFNVLVFIFSIILG